MTQNRLSPGTSGSVAASRNGGQVSSPRTRRSLQGWTLGLVAVGTFMLMLDLSVIAVALPTIRNDLHAHFSEMQWVFDAYALTLAAFLVTAGSLADRYGRKRIFMTGLVVFTLGSAACAAASSIIMLDVSRGVQGIGGAIMFAVGPALLGHEFRGKQRAGAFAAFGAAIGVAVAAGPLAGGALVNGPGWRWIFIVNIPVGIVTLALCALRLRESRLAKADRADVLGMVVFTAALAALVLAIIRANSDGWLSASNVSLYVFSALALIAFLLIARRRGERAMFDLSLFSIRTFAGLCALTLIANAGGFPSIFLETTYLQSVLGSSAWEAGLQYLPLTGAMFVFGGITGALLGKVPFRFLMGAACALVGTGLLLTHRTGAHTSWTALIPALVVTGAGFGLFNPTRSALSIGVVEPSRAGAASGMSEAFQQVGIALGIAIAGSYFEAHVIDWFKSSDLAAPLGTHVHDVGSAVSAGSIDAAAHSAGPLGPQILADGRVAFTSAFHSTMTLCAVFAFVAMVIALLTLRNKDLHESAVIGVPPEIPGEEDESELLDGAGVPAAQQTQPQPVGVATAGGNGNGNGSAATSLPDRTHTRR
jgi:EmrB/QacA subfamily drug resistance transporter